MNEHTRRNLLQFFSYTVVFSWFFWLPGVLNYFDIVAIPEGLLTLLMAVGALGPATSALILTRREAGRTGLKLMLRSAFNVKQHWRFWLGAIGLILAVHASARVIFAPVTDDLPVSSLLESPAGIIPMFIIIFFVGGGLCEEIGWRGYALDRLQQQYSALIASLLLSAIWIGWHLPLFFYEDTNQSLIPFWLFIVSVIPLGIMLTWVYNTTQTIFAAALFHTVGDLAHDLFRVMPTEDHSSLFVMVEI